MEINRHQPHECLSRIIIVLVKTAVDKISPFFPNCANFGDLPPFFCWRKISGSARGTISVLSNRLAGGKLAPQLHQQILGDLEYPLERRILYALDAAPDR